jgi:hypothetical protein
MVKLRHINGSNLKELELKLQEVKNSIIVLGVNNVGGNWFIHFLVQDTFSDNLEVAYELNTEAIAKSNTKSRRVKI